MIIETGSPITGCRFYFLHLILLNWCFDFLHTILRSSLEIELDDFDSRSSIKLFYILGRQKISFVKCFFFFKELRNFKAKLVKNEIRCRIWYLKQKKICVYTTSQIQVSSFSCFVLILVIHILPDKNLLEFDLSMKRDLINQFSGSQNWPTYLLTVLLRWL